MDIMKNVDSKKCHNNVKIKFGKRPSSNEEFNDNMH
jgi:hypothetical protein